MESTSLSWSSSGVYQESIRSIRTLSGLLMESIRSPSGVHQEYQDFIRTPDGLHQDSWGSVTYRLNPPDANGFRPIFNNIHTAGAHLHSERKAKKNGRLSELIAHPQPCIYHSHKTYYVRINLVEW